jgi:paraquat-inducible protein B
MAINAQGSTTNKFYGRDSYDANIREERNGTMQRGTCERDEADNLIKNKYAVSLYNLSVQEKNVDDFKAEIKRCQKALQKFSSEEQKQRIKAELFHYKTELVKVEKKVAQIKKTIDRRARALSSTTTTTADTKAWEMIATYAKHELAHHQKELAVIEEEVATTKKKISAVAASSSGIIRDELLDEHEEQGCSCFNGMEPYWEILGGS